MGATSCRVSGELRVPGDKSISHRALILGALATGRSRVGGVLQSADVSATAASLRAMGWSVPDPGDAMTIEGGGLRAPMPDGRARLDCANSGTTARLMSGIAAAARAVSELDGDASLRRRPMRRVAEPLEAMGARFEWLAAAGRLPMRVHGGDLGPVDWATPVPSAQVKSAILLAGLSAGVPVCVREPLPTRDHTERMLRAGGVEVRSNGLEVTLTPAASLAPLDLVVPGDPSSAAFFAALAAAAAHGTLLLRGVLLNAHRTGFLRHLRGIGASVDVLHEEASGGEVVGDLLVRAGPLQGGSIGPADVPALVDEIPVLAVLAAVAEGETRITGAAELRVKESDRIATVVRNLRACGVHAEELPDGLVVRGPSRVRDAAVETRGDHRIAMAFGVLAALTGRDLRLDDPSCVSVSYPAFWHDLARVTR